MTGKGDVLDNVPTVERGCLEPVSANAKIVVASKPVGIGHHFHPLSSDKESGNGQDEPESRQVTYRANLGFLNVPSIGLVVEETLFNVKI